MVSRTDAQNATPTAVRNGRTIIKGVKIEQRTVAAPVLYLQIFNTNAPTVGTTAPVTVIQVPAGNANLSLNYQKQMFQGSLGGIDLSTGCAYAVTTTHDGNTAPTAGHEPTIELHYETLG